MPTARAGWLTLPADPASPVFAELTVAVPLATVEGDSSRVRRGGRKGGTVRDGDAAARNGDVAVTRQNKAADAVINVDRAPFEAIVTGRMNAQAALLRGVLTCEGSMAA